MRVAGSTIWTQSTPASAAFSWSASANKCIEGVPGFSFAICRRDSLEATEGWARSLSLDLLAQWRGLESNGQFRFTPPTHTILAFEQALRELQAEGGIEGRAARYRGNYETLVAGMREMGFVEYLPPARQGAIMSEQDKGMSRGALRY